jgi:DNA damage-inducible protein 1
MKISILGSDGELNVLELPEGDTDLIVELIAAEVGIPLNELKIVHYGNEFFGSNFSTMELKSDDIISVQRNHTRKVHLHDLPPNITPEALLELVNQNPHLLGQLHSADPEMGSAVSTRDPGPVRMLMMKRLLNGHKVQYDQKVEEDRIWSDPDNPENQQKIADRIRQQNVQASMETAMDEMPETFGSVHMLYINIEVNGHPIKAFVDSGAQSTIMSVSCAEKCGVSRLVDTRFAGEARGVGTAKIIGRVHIAQMKLGRSFFPISLTVLENDDVDMLFGLDMLKRHRCVIDLSANVLRIETCSGVEEAPFLSEADLPKKGLGAFGSGDGSSGSGSGGDAVSKGAPSPATPPPVSTSSATSPRRSRANSQATLEDPESQHLVNQGVIYLTSLGFSIMEASNALSQADGDVELAAELLFASRT